MKRFFIVAIALIMGFITGPVYADGLLGAAELWESYTAGDDTDSEAYGANWFAQTFTTETSHTITYVRLKLYQEGTPGVLEVQIQGVTSDGKPDGEELTSGIINGTLLSAASPGGWYRINIDPYTLSVDEEYAIVLRGTGSSSANNIHWRKDGSAATYTGGQSGASTDNGGSWTMDADDDYMFEVWGEFPLAISNAKVFTGYVTAGDWLFVAEYANFYKPYYPSLNPVNWFAMQLVETDTDDVVAQVPLAQWGYKPTSIYISTLDALSMQWGGNYSLRMMGLSAPYPNVSYDLTDADWIGPNLVLLDDWCIALASDIQTYYGTDPSEGECCLVASLDTGKSVLNSEAAIIFRTGIPYLDKARPNIFAVTIQQGEVSEGNYSWAYVESLDWEATVGPEIANASTEFSYYWFSIERPTGGRIFLGVLLFLLFTMVAAVGVPTGHHTAGLVLGFPILIAGCWMNVLPWAAAGAVLIILILLLVKNFWWGGT